MERVVGRFPAQPVRMLCLAAGSGYWDCVPELDREENYQANGGERPSELAAPGWGQCGTQRKQVAGIVECVHDHTILNSQLSKKNSILG